MPFWEYLEPLCWVKNRSKSDPFAKGSDFGRFSSRKSFSKTSMELYRNSDVDIDAEIYTLNMNQLPSTSQSWMPSRIDLFNADELGQDQEMAVQRQGIRWHKHNTMDDTQGNECLPTLGENFERQYDLLSAGAVDMLLAFCCFIKIYVYL